MPPPERSHARRVFAARDRRKESARRRSPDPHQRRKAPLRFPALGDAPTPSCTSPRRCGRTSAPRISLKHSRRSTRASAASAASRHPQSPPEPALPSPSEFPHAYRSDQRAASRNRQPHPRRSSAAARSTQCWRALIDDSHDATGTCRITAGFPSHSRRAADRRPASMPDPRHDPRYGLTKPVHAIYSPMRI